MGGRGVGLRCYTTVVVASGGRRLPVLGSGGREGFARGREEGGRGVREGGRRSPYTATEGGLAGDRKEELPISD